MKGNNRVLPDGVKPNKAEYTSDSEKLFWYNFTPKSLIAWATISLEIP